jgi:hypothetical protein
MLDSYIENIERIKSTKMPVLGIVPFAIMPESFLRLHNYQIKDDDNLH